MESFSLVPGTPVQQLIFPRAKADPLTQEVDTHVNLVHFPLLTSEDFWVVFVFLAIAVLLAPLVGGGTGGYKNTAIAGNAKKNKKPPLIDKEATNKEYYDCI